ncbi:hypothetical protein Ahy_B03g061949 isoform C [Arachis hypogaea]|nr:hypothetical protein Ahy_B03g061949 isoform C [Arachis hypogaea]
MFVMRTIARNKVKLSNHVGKLPPVIKSRLEKVRKESKNWHPIWTGDDGYEKFEVHGYPTNHVVDLGKNLCTCQFWMLTGIPCVHACAALSRVNKPPENFCHPLVTMESYKATYNHHINPIPGQPLWEVSEFNKPRAPKVKRPPGKLQMKRRMDSDEKHGGGKRLRVDTKNNDNTHLKRQLGKFTCSYCGDKGHTKRGCKKKRLADAAAAAAAAAAVAEAEAATKNKEGEGGGDPTADQTCVATSDGTNQQGEGGNVQPIDLAPIVTAASDVQQVELDLSQPTCFEQEDSQQVKM